MQRNVSLLLALLQMSHRSSNIRKSTTLWWNVFGALMVCKTHGKVVVQRLERKLVSKNHALVLGLVFVELGNASLGTLHRVVDRAVLENLFDFGDVITQLTICQALESMLMQYRARRSSNSPPYLESASIVFAAHAVVLLGQRNQLLNASNGQINFALIGNTIVVFGNIDHHTVFIQLLEFFRCQVLFELEVRLGRIHGGLDVGRGGSLHREVTSDKQNRSEKQK
jgi:hypothetical protein